MMLWYVELSKTEKKKVAKSWIGLYKMKKRLGPVEYVIESEAGVKRV